MSECCPSERGRSTEQSPSGPSATVRFPATDASCCGPVQEVLKAPGPPPSGEVAAELPGYQLWPFVDHWVETPLDAVPGVSTALRHSDRWGRWQMRWGIGRDRYRIAPGLYAVGKPGPDAEVLVTANYKMSFDALRSRLSGHDLWVLVLETYGINVWCAAGKGTFGTDEVIRRVRAVDLDRVVTHRRLILPQLGAPGVAAHEVRKGCGFSVVYGPVRASDLPAFLAAGCKATPDMRSVTFSTLDRIILTPVELEMLWRKETLWGLLGLFALGGLGPGWFSFGAAWQRGWPAVLAVLVGLLAGAVATPVLLPWLPGRLFSVKGAVAGVVAALAWLLVTGFAAGVWGSLALLLAIGTSASYVAMNFTGSTPYTSPSGVEAEMRRVLPFQVGGGALAVISWFIAAFM